MKIKYHKNGNITISKANLYDIHETIRRLEALVASEGIGDAESAMHVVAHAFEITIEIKMKTAKPGDKNTLTQENN